MDFTTGVLIYAQRAGHKMEQIDVKVQIAVVSLKGVNWSKSNGKWRARIGFNMDRLDIGHFDSEIEAALAYDSKAKELFGDFAKLNLTMRILIPIFIAFVCYFALFLYGFGYYKGRRDHAIDRPEPKWIRLLFFIR